MDIQSEKKYLLENLGFNIQTTCSVDEAVGIMLGLWNVDCYLDMEMAYQESMSPEGPHYSFSLGEYLTEERMMLQSAFRGAKYERASEAQLRELLEKIEEFDNDYMKKAKIYLCLVENEIAKGDKSELVFIGDKISLASLDQWWLKKDKFSNQQSIFSAIQQNTPKRLSKYDKELIFSEKVTFGLLLKAFVTQYIKMQKDIAKAQRIELKEDSATLNLYGQPDDPNIGEIAQKLIKTLYPSFDKNKDIAPFGYTDKSIRNRLEEVRKALNDYIVSNSVAGSLPPPKKNKT
jgi:hypothetical protein